MFDKKVQVTEANDDHLGMKVIKYERLRFSGRRRSSDLNQHQMGRERERKLTNVQSDGKKRRE